jgi:hypothetical protein
VGEMKLRVDMANTTRIRFCSCQNVAAGKPEMRQYKAVFFLGKCEVGLQSDVVQATEKP